MAYTWNKAKEDFYRGGVIFLSFAFFATITYAAISWPSTPSGEVDGGKYSARLVPSGFVGAFKTATCPTGWKPADGTNGNPDLRGEFIRGLDSGRGIDSGRTLASAQNATQVLVDNDTNETLGAIDWTFNDLPAMGYEPSTYSAGLSIHYVSSVYVSSSNSAFLRSIRPRNVALLFCVKD